MRVGGGGGSKIATYYPKPRRSLYSNEATFPHKFHLAIGSWLCPHIVGDMRQNIKLLLLASAIGGFVFEASFTQMIFSPPGWNQTQLNFYHHAVSRKCRKIKALSCHLCQPIAMGKIVDAIQSVSKCGFRAAFIIGPFKIMLCALKLNKLGCDGQNYDIPLLF